MIESDLVARIKELEHKEMILNNIILKSDELVQFISDWDSEDESRLPLSHYGKVESVRRFVSFLSPLKPNLSSSESKDDDIINSFYLIKKSLESNPNCDSKYLFDCCANATEIAHKAIEKLECKSK